jgi:hypothetical protein
LLRVLVDGLHEDASVLRVVIREHAVAQVGNVAVGPETSEHVLHLAPQDIGGSVEGTGIQIAL